jgi:hypothetical protein
MWRMLEERGGAISTKEVQYSMETAWPGILAYPLIYSHARIELRGSWSKPDQENV